MGDYILMRGMGLTVLPVSLHKLELDCGLVQGEVAMAVRPAPCYTRKRNNCPQT